MRLLWCVLSCLKFSSLDLSLPLFVVQRICDDAGEYAGDLLYMPYHSRTISIHLLHIPQAKCVIRRSSENTTPWEVTGHSKNVTRVALQGSFACSFPKIP